MPRWLRRLFFTMLLGIWAIGLWFICTKMPVGPHEGWQPSKDDMIFFVLPDGESCVVGHKIASQRGIDELSLRNLNTGKVKYTQPIPSTLHGKPLQIVPAGNWLALLPLQQNQGIEADQKILPMYDAKTGKLHHEFVARPRWPSSNVWFKLSHDGNSLLLLQSDDIEVWNVPDKKRLFTIRDVLPQWCFSPDGKQVAVRRNSGIAIFDLTQPEAQRSQIPSPYAPKAFSPDGSLLLDDELQVWEIATARFLFNVKNAVNESISKVDFSRNGQLLVVITNKNNYGMWINYFDATTGVFLEDRYKQLADSDPYYITISEGGIDRKWVVLTDHKSPATRTLPLFPMWKKWLAKIPGFDWLIEQSGYGEYHVFDLETGELLEHGSADHAAAMHQSDLLYVHKGTKSTLWNIPHRKPYKKMSFMCIVWTFFFVLPMAGYYLSRRNYLKKALAGLPRRTKLHEATAGLFLGLF